MHTYTHIHTYIHTYTYICIYTHIHTYIYTNRWPIGPQLQYGGHVWKRRLVSEFAWVSLAQSHRECGHTQSVGRRSIKFKRDLFKFKVHQNMNDPISKLTRVEFVLI